jgi:hypothetical protein
MEADWEFELGTDAAGIEAPVIDAAWAGFIDLRRSPELALQLPESMAFPALAEALIRLNGDASPVWTSKCDYWPSLEADAFDADELDAPPGGSAHGMGCYLDLLARGRGRWMLPETAEKACKIWCGLLKAVPLRGCRVDLVIRRALFSPTSAALGVTAYLTACGASPAEAAQSLRAALVALIESFPIQA